MDEKIIRIITITILTFVVVGLGVLIPMANPEATCHTENLALLPIMDYGWIFIMVMIGTILFVATVAIVKFCP